MNKSIDKSNVNRRQFLKKCGSVATGAAVLGSIAPSAFAGEDNTIRLALLGCGGRGTGAVGDALSVKNGGPIKLYARSNR
jgi:secreted PhoX family phosphatase